MSENKNLVRPSIIPIVIAILLLFIVPILLLAKVITPTPNAEYAHKLLMYYAGPVTIFTMFYQWIFIKVNMKRILTFTDIEQREVEVYRLYALRLWLTFGALIANFIFLSLTNFDQFLVFNILLVLWMINLFPYSHKILALLKK